MAQQLAKTVRRPSRSPESAILNKLLPLRWIGTMAQPHNRPRKQIPAKCIRCAMLSMAEVRSLHGETGDNCYVSTVCRSRRSYARHHHQRNASRRQKWQEQTIDLEANQSESQLTADLIVERAARYGAPIESIAAVVRQGKTKLAVVQPIYSAGLSPKQIYACIEAILDVLKQDYGLTQFANLVQQLPRSNFESEPVKARSPRHRVIHLNLPDVSERTSALLIVYRHLETEAVVAIKIEVWRGATVEAGVPLLDCRGLLPSQIHAFLSQALALLESHYGIRWFARLATRPADLSGLLSEAIEQSAEAQSQSQSQTEIAIDLDPLWQALETSLHQLDLAPDQALAVAADGITEIVLQFTRFATLTFEELEAVAEQGVVLPPDAFDRYVRQSIDVNFEPFIAPRDRSPRKASSRLPIKGESVVGDIDQAALLQVLNEQMSQEAGLTEAEIFNQSVDVAHQEDVSAWTKAIRDGSALLRAQSLTTANASSISLTALQQHLQRPLVEIWLGLLLGGFQLEQRGSFYGGEIWVRSPDADLDALW